MNKALFVKSPFLFCLVAAFCLWNFAICLHAFENVDPWASKADIEIVPIGWQQPRYNEQVARMMQELHPTYNYPASPST